MATVTINASAITKRIEDAFSDANQILHREMVSLITDDRWNWPTGGQRDIVDTGLLRSSQQPARVINNVARHVNTAGYAYIVHQGYTTRSGFTAPERPWMTTALKELNMVKVMSKLLGSTFRGNIGISGAP